MARWMDEIFEGAQVPPWLRRFEEAPVEALHELLIGIAALGHLGGAEPDILLLDWLEALGDKGEFRRRVDEALATWIEHSWGEPLLGPPPGSAARTAQAWCRAADVIAMEPAMREAAAALKPKVVAGRRFLSALTEGASRDPLGRAWVALARHQQDQQDRSLVEEWWQLCKLPPNEPWHRGECGIHGLRGLPPSPEEEHAAGGFSLEVARGLVLLGNALAERADEHWLRQEVARDEFLRTARLTMAAYPMPERWAAFWEEELRSPKGATVETWLRTLSQAFTSHRKPVRSWKMLDPRWQEANPIADQLARGGLTFGVAVEKATALLNHQQAYAEVTGNGSFIARSACKFAKKVSDRDPTLALSWLHLTRRFDPWDAYTWTDEVSLLLELPRLDEALRVSWEASERFPEDVVAQTSLAEVFRAQGKLDHAEAQYRLTIDRFPEDVVAQTGLAEVFRAQGKLDHAEAQYRRTIDRFPDNVVAQTGLAEVFRAQGKLDHAEAQYRLTLERFPNDEFARTGLATVRKPKTAGVAPTRPILPGTPGLQPSSNEPPPDAPIPIPVAEALHPPRLTATDLEILLTDAGLLRRWARQIGLTSGFTPGQVHERARDLLQRLDQAQAYDARAAGERGLLTLAEGEIDKALDLLRVAVRRFPGSARVRYALARAERQKALEEHRKLDPNKPEALAVPWRQLERINSVYRPVHLLGEGRAWLAQVDGETVEKGARNAFGQLGSWIHRHVDHDDARQGGSDASPADLCDQFKPSKDFSGWWAREVQIHLFGKTEINRADDIDRLEPIQERIAEYGPQLDELEENWMSRFAQA